MFWKIVGWIATFILFVPAVTIITISPIGGMLIAAAGGLLCPPLYARIKHRLTLRPWMVAVAVLLLLGFAGHAIDQDALPEEARAQGFTSNRDYVAARKLGATTYVDYQNKRAMEETQPPHYTSTDQLEDILTLAYLEHVKPRRAIGPVTCRAKLMENENFVLCSFRAAGFQINDLWKIRNKGQSIYAINGHARTRLKYFKDINGFSDDPTPGKVDIPAVLQAFSEQ